MLTFEKALPEETGIPSGCILQFIDRLRRQQIPMHSLLLMHQDKLIAEGYYAPCRQDTLHRMFSISKSFTSIAVSLLMEEGKLSLDDPVIRYFPDKVPKDVHPFIAEMTIRDMLMMRTCHASTTYKLDMTKDWVESFFTTPPTHPAGRLFHYDTSSAHTLCALVERLSGMPMLTYIKEKLSELDFSESSYMITDPFGVSLGGSGLVATSMDLMRFAYLISHKGRVNGKQLVSSSYIEEATSHLTDTLVTAPIQAEAKGYGYQFWRNQKNGYTCYGMGGQLIIFLPDYDLICVTTADTQGIGGGNQAIYDALFEEILPFAGTEPLPVSPESQNAFLQKMNTLRLEPLEGAFHSPITPQIKNAVFHAAPNAMGFETLRLTFSSAYAKNSGSPAAGTLHFQLNQKEYSLSFGFGELITGSFPIYELFYGASAAWLSENTLYIKAHIIDSYVGSVHFQLVFGKEDVTVFLKKQEESLFQEFNGHLYCTL